MRITAFFRLPKFPNNRTDRPAGGIVSGQKGSIMNGEHLGDIPDEERLIDRMEQLREYLNNFPDCLGAAAARNELQRLENIQEQWFI